MQKPMAVAIATCWNSVNKIILCKWKSTILKRLYPCDCSLSLTSVRNGKFPFTSFIKCAVSFDIRDYWPMN